jgi:hypothetical protein
MLQFKRGWRTKALVVAGLATCAGFIALGVLSLGERIGQENAHCDQFDRFNISNGQGKVITAYTTVCTTLGTSVVSYVFVHDETDRPRTDNLIFRYTQSGGAQPVDLNWMDTSHISVKVRDIRDIGVMEEHAGAMSIQYVIQKAIP